MSDFQQIRDALSECKSEFWGYWHSLMSESDFENHWLIMDLDKALATLDRTIAAQRDTQAALDAMPTRPNMRTDSDEYIRLCAQWLCDYYLAVRAALTAQPAESVEGLGEINKEFGKVRNALDDMLERTDGIHALEKIAIFCNTVIRPILSQPKQPDVNAELLGALKYAHSMMQPFCDDTIVKQAIANAEQKGKKQND